MNEDKKEAGYYDATKEGKKTHPIQGLVWGIASLYLSVVSLFILIPQPIFLAVYSGLKAGGTVGQSNLATVSRVFLILTVVYGCISFFFALAVLVIHANTMGMIEEAMPDSRARAGLVTSKIAFVLAIIGLSLSVVSTVLLVLFLIL